MLRRDAWMGAVGEGGGIRRPAENSGVEVVGQGLVEVEVGDRVGLGGVEGGHLIEELDEEIALGRSASGREGGGLWGRSRCMRMAETTGVTMTDLYTNALCGTFGA